MPLNLNLTKMKRTILVFGSISGLIIAAIMVYSTVTCIMRGDFDSSLWLGYASMILAFSLIFIGIRNFRDKHNDGVISFGKAFKIGFFIALISSSVYVGVWLIEYYVFFPDFMEQYSDHILNQARLDGATQAELDQKTSEMDMYKDMYQNPVFVVLLTYAEVLPVGLLITLISALILKRKPKDSDVVSVN